MPPQRVRASGRNLRVSLAGHIGVVVFNFITRRMFLGVLGSECTGFAGLCAHILNLLSLLEPGFDAACTFYLYKPLAREDYGLATQIAEYLRRVCRRICLLTVVVGMLLSPVALALSGDGLETEFALAVYWLILAEGAMSFLLTHRRILPFADQKGYVVTGYGYVTFILSRFVQLAVLLYSRNYIAYLFSGIVAGLVGELALYKKIGRMYPLLKAKSRPPEAEHRNAIKSKVRSLFFCKVGSILCSSTDNMAVFAFLGLSAGAEYSNYTMLTGTCLAFVTITTGAVSASVGNLGATSGSERMKKVFGTVYFAVFVLASFFAQALFFACPMIVGVWVGADMILPTITTALFCLQMLVSSVRKPVGVFLDGFGLFEKEKYKSLAEGGITLVATLVLAPIYGIAGVVLGQLCASLGFSFFFEAYILYRYGFGADFSEFLRASVKYCSAFFLSLGLSAVIFTVFGGHFHGISGIVFAVAECGFSVGAVFSVLFFDCECFRQSGRYFRKMMGSADG